jgi:2-oxoglutarate/2-oxoacid ferredoxin oxidoreductase subunit alpha
MTRQLLFGNSAFCEGAIAAGVRFYAGYPITPATEVAEFMSRRMVEVGGTYIQMEDELASLNAVVGASAAGVKSITATAGPGMALIQNELGQAIAAEVPAVVINVGRAGPGIGNATRSGQMEVMQARYGPNGECPAVVISPATVEEAFWLTIKAVNLSEMLRTVVIVLAEGFLGLQRAVVDLPDDYSKIEVTERPRPTMPPGEYNGAYIASEITDVPPLADFGSGYKSIINTVGIQPRHGGDGSTSAGIGTRLENQEFTIRRLHEKILSRKDEIIMHERHMIEDAEVVYVAFGTQAQSAYVAMQQARAKGIKAGVLRLITIWPFPEEVVRECCENVRAVIVPEMNLGQARMLVVNALAGSGVTVEGVNHINSTFIEPDEIVAKTEEVLQ